MRKRWLVILASLAVVLLLAVGGIGSVVAHEAGAGAGWPLGNREERQQAFLDRLAQNLGVSTAELEEGMRQTAEQYVDDALAAGLITQEQADEAKERISQSNGLSALQRMAARFHHRQHAILRGIMQQVADELQLTPEELRDELQEGKSLKQVIEEQGSTVDAVVDAVVDAAAQRLEIAVDNNRLTREQADKMLEHLRTRLTDAINNGAPHVKAS